MDAGDIGIDPEAGKPFEHVGMEIDKSGCDRAAVDLDHAASLVIGDVRSDAGYGAVIDGDVMDTAEGLGRID
jgi:hypothetical protein